MKAGKPAFVEESFLSFAEARRLVLELGGIPSYPVLADGASPICEFESDPDKLIERASAARRSRSRVDSGPQQAKRRRRIRDEDASGGARRHRGHRAQHARLDPLRSELQEMARCRRSIREVFWEGACVVAAHQFLSLHGECGYVDADGRPNPGYPSADERIRSMAKIGAAVIQRYFDTCAAQ